MMLDELKKVFSVFCFTGEIIENDANNFVLKMKCYSENLSNFEKDWVFQDIEKAFKRVHPLRELRKFNGIEIEFESDGFGNYLIFEKHFEDYSETNWCFDE